MTTPAAQVREALAAGRAAAAARALVTTNPYRGNADNARERVLARAWMLGYGAANPMPADLTA